MLSLTQSWLKTTALTDPVERRQAVVFQGMLVIIIAACAVGLPLSWLTNGLSLTGTLGYGGILVATVVSLLLLRQGKFAPSVLLIAGATVLGIGLSVVTNGLLGSSSTLLAFSAPITMAGLLQGRRGLLFAVGMSVVIVAITAALHQFAPSIVGIANRRDNSQVSIALTFTLLVSVLALFIDRFGSSLRQALVEAQAYAHELEQLRSSLQSTVDERTASLQAALGEVAQREAHLTEALEALRASNDTVRAMSAPILPVLPGVLVAPLVGDVDADRAALLTSNVLGAVERQRVHHVIFDITGVPVVDTEVAQVLIDAASAVRLLGAGSLLVGVRPEVAQTLVSLGIDLQSIATYSDLRAAVGALLT